MPQALLFCHGTGTYSGGLLVQEMLTEHMGFPPGNVDFSSDSSERSAEDRRLSLAAIFKQKLGQLLEGMQAGDVRLLYVDGPRNPHPEVDGYSEYDTRNLRWLLSQDEGGDTVTYEWISQAIRAVSDTMRGEIP